MLGRSATDKKEIKPILNKLDFVVFIFLYLRQFSLFQNSVIASKGET